MKLARMLAVAATAAVAAVATAAGAATPAHVAASKPPCVPKYGSSGGHTYVDYCGPATATLKVGGKTYDFKDGYCSTDAKAGIALELTLGVIDEAKSPVNGGKTLFQLQDIKTSAVSVVSVNVDYAGKALPLNGASLKGSIPGGGTIVAGQYSKPSFSGTWNCHGVVVATP
jgi:transcription elongation factor